VCVSAAHTDQPLLLPLTSSLYVKGKVASTDTLLVNVGTDYYVEVCGGCTHTVCVCVVVVVVVCVCVEGGQGRGWL
jgi:hypothetical protein